MLVLAAYAVTLLVAVLLSAHAKRTIFSETVLFLGAGALTEMLLRRVWQPDPRGPAVYALIEVTTFGVLFTDGARVDPRALRAGGAWSLPVRALLIGMPVTLATLAVLAHLIADLRWPLAVVVGAILSPTDPVLSADIVRREDVPSRLRDLLNLESGLNDGLALPFVLAFAALAASESVPWSQMGAEVAKGAALGLLVPWGGSIA